MDPESESHEDKSVTASQQGKKVKSSKSVGEDKSSPTARFVIFFSILNMLAVSHEVFFSLVGLTVTTGLSMIYPSTMIRLRARKMWLQRSRLEPLTSGLSFHRPTRRPWKPRQRVKGFEKRMQSFFLRHWIYLEILNREQRPFFFCHELSRR